MMMKKYAVFYITSVIIVTFVGCSKIRVWTSTPVLQTANNPYFEAELEPLLKVEEKFFNAFRLVITNKTNDNLIIDWEKTRYIHDGQNRGGFAFDGLTADNINNPPPETISADGTFEKVIWPVTLIGYERLDSPNVKIGGSGFSRGVLPEGENSVDLVVRRNKQEIREIIKLNIEVTEITK
jgi:hypothetical protein